MRTSASTPVPELLGLRIQHYRHAKGLSQSQLARLADVPDGTIKHLEQGVAVDPHVSTVMRLARALDVGIGELLEGAVLGGGLQLAQAVLEKAVRE